MYSKEEARQLKHDFWEGFDRYTKYYSKQVGTPINWMLYKTGIKGLEFKFYIEKKLFQVMIEVNHKNENRRFDIFVELNKYKNILESDIDREIFWVDDFDVDDKKVVSRIFVEQTGLNFNRQDDWPEIYKFLAKYMFIFQSNFEDIHEIFKEKFTGM